MVCMHVDKMEGWTTMAECLEYNEKWDSLDYMRERVLLFCSVENKEAKEIDVGMEFVW